MLLNAHRKKERNTLKKKEKKEKLILFLIFNFRFDFDAEVVIKHRIKCTKSLLLYQFEQSFGVFHHMARELHKTKEDANSSQNQVQ